MFDSCDYNLLLDQLNEFNRNFNRIKHHFGLIARICGDYIFIDKDEDGIVKFFCRLVYSQDNQDWKIQVYNNHLSSFNPVNSDHLGYGLIDGTLDGALKFCEFSID